MLVLASWPDFVTFFLQILKCNIHILLSSSVSISNVSHTHFNHTDIASHFCSTSRCTDMSCEPAYLIQFIPYSFYSYLSSMYLIPSIHFAFPDIKHGHFWLSFISSIQPLTIFFHPNSRVTILYLFAVFISSLSQHSSPFHLSIIPPLLFVCLLSLTSFWNYVLLLCEDISLKFL